MRVDRRPPRFSAFSPSSPIEGKAMSRQLHYASDYPYPTEEIFRAGIRPEYVAAEAVYLKHEEAEVLELTEDGAAGGRLKLTYKVETSLPGWAKKILPSRNTITESHVWQPAAA